MNGDAPRKRPWFQIHLSTAVVLMVVAGGLVWANVALKSIYGIYDSYGWPFDAFYARSNRSGGYFGIQIEGLHAGPALGNLIVTLAILTAVAVGCEWWVRRRGKARQAELPNSSPSHET